MSGDPHVDPRMTLGQHLEELRLHVLRALGYLAVALMICLGFQGTLMTWATWPHRRVVAQLAEELAVEEAPSSIQDELTDAVHREDELTKALERIERREAALRERIEPSTQRLADLTHAQAALEADVQALSEEAAALGDEPNAAAIAALSAKRRALAERAAALHRRMEVEVRPFLDKRAKPPRMELVQLRYQEGFLAFVKLSLVAALFLASPFIARELWGFVAAGLYAREKRYVNLFAPLSFAAFLVGAAFGYTILIPLGLRFLATYPPPELVAGTFSLSDYLSLFVTLTVVVGAVFELPLIMTFLSLIGAVSAEKFRTYRRYWLLTAFVVAALLTPPDPVTQCLMAVPLVALYEVGILLAVFIHRKPTAPERSDPLPPTDGGGPGLPPPPTPYTPPDAPGPAAWDPKPKAAWPTADGLPELGAPAEAVARTPGSLLPPDPAPAPPEAPPAAPPEGVAEAEPSPSPAAAAPADPAPAGEADDGEPVMPDADLVEVERTETDRTRPNADDPGGPPA